MDDKMKADMMLLFNQGFEDVILPQIEEISEDLKGVKEELKGVKEELKQQKLQLDRVENKLDKQSLTSYEDKVVKKQNDHENRIQKLEKKRVTLA